MSDPLREAELSALCAGCGLCCDGTLFRGAGLLPEEVPLAHKLRLTVIEDGRGFAQPCPQFVDHRCAVYEERPSACRSFVCGLFAAHREQGGPIEARHAVVRRARALVAQLQEAGMSARGESERSMEFDSPETMEAFVELMTLIGDNFRRA